MCQELDLKFGIGFGDNAPKVRFPIIEKSTITGINSVSWYLRSINENKIDGTHFGSIFLQLRRDVKKLLVTSTLYSDWNKKDKFPNIIESFSTILDVFYPPVPSTPILTDFSSVEDIPLLIPRDDIRSFMQISNSELDQLISKKLLTAFGEGNKVITRKSLLDLLDS